jgi:hypothetical protein
MSQAADGVGRRGSSAAIDASDEVHEHGEEVDVVGLAPRREHVMGKLVYVTPLPAVRVNVDL